MRTTRLLVLALASLTTGCLASSEAVSDDDPACTGKCDGAAAAFGGLGDVRGVRLDGTTAVRLDARKNTYTRRGVFTLHAVFDPTDGKEEADAPTADHFQASYEISPDDYLRAFEGTADVELPVTRGPIYRQHGSAVAGENGRTVTLAWDNSDAENTRKGELVIELDDRGQLTTATMRKWSKGWLFGWNLVFEDQLLEPTREATGLLLRDDADLGLVTSDSAIRTAVAEPTPEQFRALLDAP